MSKPSPRKQKKQRKHKEQKLQRQLIHARKVEYQQRYPGFSYLTGNGDPAFVKLVKQAVAQINFDDESVFPRWESATYRVIKQFGWGAGSAFLEGVKAKLEEQGAEGTEQILNLFILRLGETVFDLIGETTLQMFLPYNDVAFHPRGPDIHVVFDSLLHAKGSGGTVYYSRKKPAIEINGKKKIVAFSKHAIDRIGQRITPDKTYAAAGDLFSFLSHCVYFERSDLSGGQLGFTFYDKCDQEHFVQHRYLTDVLGIENVDPAKGGCYYRVGYCPAIIEGEFIKAKTLLYPGFTGTPEYAAILRSSLSQQEKQSMFERANRLDASSLFQHDFGLIKWFHDHGVPQVVQLRQPVFIFTPQADTASGLDHASPARRRTP